MQDGVMFRHSYKLNLDSLSVGDVIGMMRHPDTSLHFYLNGIDQGAACFSVPQNVYPVIDLYGQCAQVPFCFCASILILKKLPHI